MLLFLVFITLIVLNSMIIVGRGLATASIRCLVARVQVLELVLSLKQVKNVSILISDLNDLGGEELSA